jgi:hypothetical protein
MAGSRPIRTSTCRSTSAELDELAPDLEPYRRLELDAVMPAHVIYRWLDLRPAGFSRFWTGLLRNELGFDGVIFSDDLSMAGASVAGGIVERCTAAWDAGCDLLLVCNSPDAVGELLANWQPPLRSAAGQRVERLSLADPALSTGLCLQQDANLPGRRGSSYPPARLSHFASRWEPSRFVPAEYCDKPTSEPEICSQAPIG